MKRQIFCRQQRESGLSINYLRTVECRKSPKDSNKAGIVSRDSGLQMVRDPDSSRKPITWACWRRLLKAAMPAALLPVTYDARITFNWLRLTNRSSFRA